MIYISLVTVKEDLIKVEWESHGRECLGILKLRDYMPLLNGCRKRLPLANLKLTTAMYQIF